MLKELVKISSLDDIENAKHRQTGLWAIGSIFRAVAEIRNCYTENFVLANNPNAYPLHQDVANLISLNDELLKLQFTDITPAMMVQILDCAECLRTQILQGIQNNASGFAGTRQCSMDLLPAVETLISCYKELLDQSRHNLLASFSIDVQDPLTKLRELCTKVQALQDHELTANLTHLTFEFLKLAKGVDPLIKNSLAFENKGL